MKSEITILENTELINQLKNLVATERKVTSEIVEFIKEVDRRKLYLQFGFTSLFAYLTEEFGYTPASAQRRIDAARMSVELPQIQEDLKAGVLNLTQVSILAQSLRQKMKDMPETKVSAAEKKVLLEQVKGQSLDQTQQIISKGLDIEVQLAERKRVQKDESVRVEVTFSKEQMADLKRVKELISHWNPNPSLSELVSLLASEFLKKKDPLRKGVRAEIQRTITSAAEAEPHQNANNLESDSSENLFVRDDAAIEIRSKNTRYIGPAIKRATFQRDRCCQWRDRKSGKLCGSRFQLQIDHKKSIWKGGGNEADTLQVLCSIHNHLKYELERPKVWSGL